MFFIQRFRTAETNTGLQLQLFAWIKSFTRVLYTSYIIQSQVGQARLEFWKNWSRTPTAYGTIFYLMTTKGYSYHIICIFRKGRLHQPIKAWSILIYLGIFLIPPGIFPIEWHWHIQYIYELWHVLGTIFHWETNVFKLLSCCINWNFSEQTFLFGLLWMHHSWC